MTKDFEDSGKWDDFFNLQDQLRLDDIEDEPDLSQKSDPSEKEKKDAMIDEIMADALHGFDQDRTEKPQPPAAEEEEPKRKKSRAPVIILAVVAAVILAGVIALFVMDGGVMVDNLYIAGVPVGGLTRDAAIAQVDAATNGVFASSSLTIVLPDAEYTVGPEVGSPKFNTGAAVNEAYRYGRLFGLVRVPLLTDAPDQRTDLDLTPYVTVNTASVQEIAEQIAKDSELEMEPSSYEVEEKETVIVDEDSDEEDEEETFIEKTLLLHKGITGRTVDAQVLQAQILAAYDDVNYAPIVISFEEKAPEALDFKAIYTKYCTDPVDATYDEETSIITPDEDGYGFVVDELEKTFNEMEEGTDLAVPFEVLTAKVTAADLKGDNFGDCLASYDSPHTDIPDRTTNLILACKAIDGTVIRDGEIFSFNDVVGERTPERGYKPAQVYTSKKTIDEPGGGCCQVASTIYLCALMADLDIVERHEHYFQVTYVPLGMDATIYWGALDFRFKNNTGYPIRIDASVSDGAVHIALYGTETKDYTVKMSFDVVEYAEKGMYVNSYKTKYDKDGNEISSKLCAKSYYNYHPDEDEEDEENPDHPNENAPDPNEHTQDPPPVDDPPVVDPPVDDPPVVDPPVDDPPVDDPPVDDPPVNPDDPGVV